MRKRYRGSHASGGAVSRRALLSSAAVAAAAGGVAAAAVWASRGEDRVAEEGAAGAAESELVEPSASPALDVEAREAWVDSVIDGMSLEVKVGQLFMVYVYGDAADTEAYAGDNQALHGVDNAVGLFEQYGLGGIIYFDWTDNLSDPGQIARLSAGIQAAAVEHTGVQALIGVDQEHGAITRIGEPVTPLPGAMALGASHDAAVAEESARICGAELRAMGINLDFAPVADVNVNPANPVIGSRSFSSDPALAAAMVAAQVAGFQTFDGGVSACAKHFPGHGDTDVDSHVGLPRITHSEEEWRSIDLPPFTAAVEAGTDLIMSAHLQFPALDSSETPATLSEPILTGLLRDQLGYEGVITTDALNMEGVRVQHSDADIPVLALRAGADLLLMPKSLGTAYDAVLAAVQDGTLTAERIDQSVRRLLRLRYHRGLTASPLGPSEAAAAAQVQVGTDAHRQSAQVLFDKTVAVVAGGELLPIPDGASVYVGGSPTDAVSVLVEALNADGVNASSSVNAAEADFAVVLCEDASEWGDQMGTVRQVAEAGTPTAAVSTGKPYDVAYFPDGVASLATCSEAAASMRSLSGVLVGRVQASAALPVEV